MLVPITFVAALALLAAPGAALPSATAIAGSADTLEAFRDASLPDLVYAEAIKGGLWTVYDDKSKPLLNVTANQSSSLNRRCGSNNIFCDYANFRANTAICGLLMDVLGDPVNRDLSLTPYTDQCFTATNVADNNMCCISWDRRIAGLKINMLFGAAAPQLSRCARDGLVSARATDVDLAGFCAVQCMSNRKTGCS